MLQNAEQSDESISREQDNVIISSVYRIYSSNNRTSSQQ